MMLLPCCRPTSITAPARSMLFAMRYAFRLYTYYAIAAISYIAMIRFSLLLVGHFRHASPLPYFFARGVMRAPRPAAARGGARVCHSAAAAAPARYDSAPPLLCCLFRHSYAIIMLATAAATPPPCQHTVIAIYSALHYCHAIVMMTLMSPCHFAMPPRRYGNFSHALHIPPLSLIATPLAANTCLFIILLYTNAATHRLFCHLLLLSFKRISFALLPCLLRDAD